jgi:hypothetical protein
VSPEVTAGAEEGDRSPEVDRKGQPYYIRGGLGRVVKEVGCGVVVLGGGCLISLSRGGSLLQVYQVYQVFHLCQASLSWGGSLLQCVGCIRCDCSNYLNLSQITSQT